MRTTILPPHLAAQTFATQPASRPQAPPKPDASSQGGFEALALKSANPTRLVAPRPVEPSPAPAAAPVAQAPPQPLSTAPQAPTPDRPLRPGTRLDIRV